jgi:hypothetical protein
MVVHLKPYGGTPPEPVAVIQGDTQKIHVTFTYRGLDVGELLFGRLHDDGRNMVVREMPLILPSEDGAHSFALARGMTSWLPGSYRVDLTRGDDVLATCTFAITEEGGP